MRKIFIDCGAHCGCSVKKFLNEVSDDFIIYSFEPDSSHFKYWPHLLNNKEYNIIKRAVWIDDSHKLFNRVLSERHSIGSSLFTNKVDPLRHKADIKQELVQCLDISNFILDNFTKDDFIHLKLDVECAEYEIINKMLKENTFEYINRFSWEGHNHNCNKLLDKNIDNEIECAIKNYNIEIIPWKTEKYCVAFKNEKDIH